MKLPALAIALALAASPSLAQSARVVDGDTIHVLQGLHESEIRCGIQNEPQAGGITAWIDAWPPRP